MTEPLKFKDGTASTERYSSLFLISNLGFEKFKQSVREKYFTEATPELYPTECYLQFAFSGPLYTGLYKVQTQDIVFYLSVFY